MNAPARVADDMLLDNTDDEVNLSDINRNQRGSCLKDLENLLRKLMRCLDTFEINKGKNHLNILNEIALKILEKVREEHWPKNLFCDQVENCLSNMR